MSERLSSSTKALTTSAHSTRSYPHSARRPHGSEQIQAAHVGGGAPGAPIGSFSLPPGVTVQEFLALRARYHAAIDRVLPTYAAQSAPGPEVVAAAHQIKDLTPRVLETPLLPFYRAVGADFFAWIDQTAQP